MRSLTDSTVKVRRVTNCGEEGSPYTGQPSFSLPALSRAHHRTLLKIVCAHTNERHVDRPAVRHCWLRSLPDEANQKREREKRTAGRDTKQEIIIKFMSLQ